MFDVKLDKKRHVVSFEKNEKKYNDSLRLLGFVAIVTLGLDLTAPQALAHYKLRDEQEKYFQQMKTEMCSDRQRNWSEDGKTGRLFILFVGLVIGSYIRHIWKTTGLHSMFASSLDMLDEMRNIRCIERQGHTTKITPFVGKQVEIAKVFGLDIPAGCEPGYKSKKVGRKRGSAKEKRVLEDYRYKLIENSDSSLMNIFRKKTIPPYFKIFLKSETLLKVSERCGSDGQYSAVHIFHAGQDKAVRLPICPVQWA